MWTSQAGKIACGAQNPKFSHRRSLIVHYRQPKMPFQIRLPGEVVTITWALAGAVQPILLAEPPKTAFLPPCLLPRRILYRLESVRKAVRCLS
jgi:hypothetical protein